MDPLSPVSVNTNLIGNQNIPSTGQMLAMGNNVPMSTAQLMNGGQQLSSGGGWLNSLGNWSQQNAAGLQTIGQGLGAFNTLAQIYSGFKALDLAEDQFSFTKKAWNKNYNNQVKDYENTLKDRWSAKNAAEATRGREFESMGSWVSERSLTGKAPSGG